MKIKTAVKYASRVIFLAALFFTAVCFVDTWRTPFFLNFQYKYLKIALCFAVTFCVCIINYLCEKDFVFMGRGASVISVVYIAAYIIDSLSVNFIACFGDFVVIFHLAYGLISVFTVFLTCTLIKLFTRRKNNGYNKFYNDFFIGFSLMLIFIFILIYFVLRDYSQNNVYTVNLKLFQGEIGDIIEGHKTVYAVIRSFGNVLFYTALAMCVFRFVKKYKFVLSVAVCAIVSLLSETVQYVFSSGDADIDDFVMNVFGALIGAVICKTVLEKLLSIDSHDKKGEISR